IQTTAHAEHHVFVIAQLQARCEALTAEHNVLRVSMLRTDHDVQSGLTALDVLLKAMHGQIGDMDGTSSGLQGIIDKVQTACRVVVADLQARMYGGAKILQRLPERGPPSTAARPRGRLIRTWITTTPCPLGSGTLASTTLSWSGSAWSPKKETHLGERRFAQFLRSRVHARRPQPVLVLAMV
ncbi:MAG: hypothetical protein ACKPKO_28725, partial [Candidatus Fonsibacter sp.]